MIGSAAATAAASCSRLRSAGVVNLSVTSGLEKRSPCVHLSSSNDLPAGSCALTPRPRTMVIDILEVRRTEWGLWPFAQCTATRREGPEC
jgi:hypothetical protein